MLLVLIRSHDTHSRSPGGCRELHGVRRLLVRSGVHTYCSHPTCHIRNVVSGTLLPQHVVEAPLPVHPLLLALRFSPLLYHKNQKKQQNLRVFLVFARPSTRKTRKTNKTLRFFGFLQQKPKKPDVFLVLLVFLASWGLSPETAR